MALFSTKLFRFGSLALLGGSAGAAAIYLNRPAYADSQTKGAYLWGDNSKGLIQQGALAPSYVRAPTKVPFLENKVLRALAVCPDFAVAALPNGDVIQWTGPDSHKVVLKSQNIKDLHISTQSKVAVALASNGSIWTWQLSGGDNNNQPSKLKFSSKLGWFEKVETLDCGADHLAVLTNKGRVFTGALTAQREHHGQLGIAAFPYFEPLPSAGTLHLVKLLESPVKKIACGAYHTLFLTQNGELFGCGSNKFGQLLLPYTLKNTKISVPTKINVPNMPRIAAMAAGSCVTCVKPDVPSASWYIGGDGEYGQFGTGSYSQCQVSPVRLTALDNMREYDEKSGAVVPLTIANDGWRIGQTHIFASVDNANRDWLVWGSNEHGQLGNGKLSKVIKPSPLPSQLTDYHSLGATNFVAGDKISGCFSA